MRNHGRTTNQLRSISIETNYLHYPLGSALVRFGNTWVVCSVAMEEQVPLFLRHTGRGWITSEYNMLPGSGVVRLPRGSNGRAKEIERFIGRALRSAVDLTALGSRTFTVDCDVIQADGGTRTAAVTGGFVALALALQRCQAKHLFARTPLTHQVAAVSVGLIDQTPHLDLDYTEDSRTPVDMNVVMACQGDGLQFVEVQGYGDRATFDRVQLDQILSTAEKGIQQLMSMQRQALISTDPTFEQVLSFCGVGKDDL